LISSFLARLFFFKPLTVAKSSRNQRRKYLCHPKDPSFLDAFPAKMSAGIANDFPPRSQLPWHRAEKQRAARVETRSCWPGAPTKLPVTLENTQLLPRFPLDHF
jgi:hypothetical protein